MMAADSLHVAVHLIVPSGGPIQWLSSCRRACSASASVMPSHVRAPCLERARPAAVAAFAGALAADRWGRPLPSWPQCRRLRPGELFLLSVTNPASFASRYFGPVSAADVIGVARPVWLESRS